MNIMFVAGDPSGDIHGARVVAALRTKMPVVNCIGIGGPAMVAQGFTQLLPFEPFNKMGFAEVVLHLPFFLSARKKLIAEINSKKYAALVCVDYPGLNMTLLEAAHKAGVPVVWYIVPQVWAWKKKRAETLGKFATHIATVFPFETKLFEGMPATVSFVGHPLMEELKSFRKNYSEAVRSANFKSGELTVALVPGSRVQEIKRMLPSMVAAFVLLKKQFPKLHGIVSHRSGLPDDLFALCQNIEGLNTSQDGLLEILDKADCACVTSGTATLQTALMGVPMVIVYKTSALSYAILSRIVTIKNIGLPNIVAGERLVPELVQDDATPQNIAREISGYVRSEELARKTSDSLMKLAGRLGERVASAEVAQIIVKVIQNR